MPPVPTGQRYQRAVHGELLSNWLYAGYIPNIARQGQFLVMMLISPALWNLNVTCPYLSQAPLVKEREGRHLQRASHLTLAQVVPHLRLTQATHPVDMPLLTAGGTEGDSQT